MKTLTRVRRNSGFGLLKSCLTFGYLTCSVRSKKNSTLHPSAHLWGGLRRRNRNISVDLSWFVLLYNTNFNNKLIFKDFFKNLNIKKFIDCTIFSVNKITPLTTLRKGWSTYIVRRRECFVAHIYIISLCTAAMFWNVQTTWGGWVVLQETTHP